MIIFTIFLSSCPVSQFVDNNLSRLKSILLSSLLVGNAATKSQAFAFSFLHVFLLRHTSNILLPPVFFSDVDCTTVGQFRKRSGRDKCLYFLFSEKICSSVDVCPAQIPTTPSTKRFGFPGSISALWDIPQCLSACQACFHDLSRALVVHSIRSDMSVSAAVVLVGKIMPATPCLCYAYVLLAMPAGVGRSLLCTSFSRFINR